MTAVIVIFGLAYSSSSIAYDTSAKQAFLIDFDTNQVLFEKNADVLMPPASMSKIMTAYLAFEEIKSGRLKLEDKILISENAWRKGNGNVKNLRGRSQSHTVNGESLNHEFGLERRPKPRLKTPDKRDPCHVRPES